MTHATRNPTKLVRRVLGGCFVSAALLGTGASLAQQAPSGLEKASTIAAKWVVQADAGQADAMWKSSSPTMQKSVNQADWAKYVANLRQQLGAEQSRQWIGVNKVDNPQGMPQGEYLNVVYSTQYAKLATFETVSLSKSGSGWLPVGYVVRPAQAAAGNAAPKPAAGGK
ncbi:DUF4019 domain-containing protein [Dyella jejuensis]|uniref:DUF4019 domain-containing protein n=1 Tax=Dyella jejuensis TaxID=1432009 RepID=A0ABW8JHY1_9GAMM